jgi:hypothetical protein
MISWAIKKILIILLLVFILGACAGGDETPEIEILSVAEERIQNPVFPTEGTITLVSPSLDSVKIKEEISFNLTSCLDTQDSNQIIILAENRIITSESSIQNWNTAVRAYIRIPFADKSKYLQDGSKLRVLPDNFSGVGNGNILTQAFELSPGRWFWLSWSFNPHGEMTCSSPQIAFFIR